MYHRVSQRVRARYVGWRLAQQNFFRMLARVLRHRREESLAAALDG
jgi:hypothetical protein